MPWNYWARRIKGRDIMQSKLSAALAVVVILALGGRPDAAIADTVSFDNYVSPTNNDLINNFSQTGTFTPSPYVQSLTGGITGGSVTGYYGNEYQATAVYSATSFNLSQQVSRLRLTCFITLNCNRWRRERMRLGHFDSDC